MLLVYTIEEIFEVGDKVNREALAVLVKQSCPNVNYIVRGTSVRCLATCREEIICMGAIIDTLKEQAGIAG
jgi:hypothetical protein